MVYQDNIPMNRPGVYRIQNLLNHKQYVGIGQDVLHRVSDYTTPCKNKNSIATKLYYSLLKYPSVNFLIIPSYYQLEYNRKDLLRVEADLIKVFSCVKNGYNMIESQEGGFEYGEEFRKHCSLIHNTPEVRNRHSKAALKSYSIPGYRDFHRQSIKNGLSKAVPRERQLAVLKMIASSKEIRNRATATMKKLHSENPWNFITNGISNKKLLKINTLPSGWKYGLTHRKKPTGRPMKAKEITTPTSQYN